MVLSDKIFTIAWLFSIHVVQIVSNLLRYVIIT